VLPNGKGAAIHAGGEVLNLSTAEVDGLIVQLLEVRPQLQPVLSAPAHPEPPFITFDDPPMNMYPRRMDPAGGLLLQIFNGAAGWSTYRLHEERVKWLIENLPRHWAD
jgi:hypothetical protein